MYILINIIPLLCPDVNNKHSLTLEKSKIKPPEGGFIFCKVLTNCNCYIDRYCCTDIRTVIALCKGLEFYSDLT